MERIKVTSLGQIPEADISFGDLTVFVGEQASGKSILLQLLKLVLDADDITQTLKKHGFDWHGKPEHFLSIYFGEGMEKIWDNTLTKITVDNEAFLLDKVLEKKGRKKAESLCLIPAHRAMTLKDGWPRAFTDYAIGDPYVVKRFSEDLRLLLEMSSSSREDVIFPQTGRMNKTIRDAIGENIFRRARVKLDRSGLRKRIVLDVAGTHLPFMTWSTGQREFLPLLMGLYRSMPSGGTRKKNNLNWVVIEEPEMGLHPQSISVLCIIFFDLLRRGYKVIVSTHSSQVPELIWAIQLLVKWNASPTHLSKLLDLNSTSFSTELTKTVFEERTFKTYYFSPYNEVKNISTLDAEDSDEAVSDWGGLTLFSTRVADVLSEAMWRADL